MIVKPILLRGKPLEALYAIGAIIVLAIVAINSVSESIEKSRLDEQRHEQLVKEQRPILEQLIKDGLIKEAPGSFFSSSPYQYIFNSNSFKEKSITLNMLSEEYNQSIDKSSKVFLTINSLVNKKDLLIDLNHLKVVRSDGKIEKNQQTLLPDVYVIEDRKFYNYLDIDVSSLPVNNQTISLKIRQAINEHKNGEDLTLNHLDVSKISRVIKRDSSLNSTLFLRKSHESFASAVSNWPANYITHEYKKFSGVNEKLNNENFRYYVNEVIKSESARLRRCSKNPLCSNNGKVGPVNLNRLDISNVTNMSNIFRSSQFNGDISKWTTKP